MIEIRLAKNGEEIDQRVIWKSCFGDEDSYMDLYFFNKYKKEETAVLLYNGEISAMATMIPCQLVMPKDETLEVAMLYAIATHPKYQGKGFSTQIMEFCHEHLMEKGVHLSVLVPAEPSLFDFYAKRGYETAFYMIEATFSYERILGFKAPLNQETSIEPIEAEDYNKRRQSLLVGSFYVDYNNDDIDYQKKVSQKFGADLYGINIGKVKGCAIVEWIDQGRVFIKEILMPDHLIEEGLRKMAQILPADTYIVRLPTYLGEELGGITKPFGMIKIYDSIPGRIKDAMVLDKQGYIGIAYD